MGSSNPVADHPELVPILFCLVGLFFAAYGIRSLARTRRFAATASRARGVVVDVKTEWFDLGGTASTGSWLRFPVVRYQTANGQSVTFKSRTGTMPSPYKVGRQVPVLYNPCTGSPRHPPHRHGRHGGQAARR